MKVQKQTACQASCLCLLTFKYYLLCQYSAFCNAGIITTLTGNHRTRSQALFLFSSPGSGQWVGFLPKYTVKGAWWAAVHGVAKSWTRLSNFSFTFPFHALEKEMATHSSVLAWRIPGTGEPGGLPSVGLHRVGHN